MTATQLSAQWTVTLGGIRLTVVPSPTDGADAAPGYSGAYETQDSTLTARKRDVPVFLRSFERGCGFLEESSEDDLGGYGWAEDMAMWPPNGPMPSGRRTATGGGYGLAGGLGVVLESVVFNGGLFAITSGGQCVWWSNTNPTAAPSYSPPLNFAGNPTTSFRANYLPKAITVFEDAAGAPCVVVSTYNSGTGATRMYKYTIAGGWSEGAADLGYRADSMAVVWWEGRDGVGAYRLLIQADDTTIRHCIQGSDPLVGASYVTPIKACDPGYKITRLLAAGGHAYALTTGGIMDFNEVRVWNLTPYWRESDAQTIRSAGRIHDDHIYAARRFGIDRYDLRSDGAQQRVPGECGPLAFMQDGTPIRGSITAMTEHDGWLLATVYNAEIQKSYVMRGKDRRSLGIDVRNPMVWHGAEQVLAGDALITHMTVTPNTAAGAYYTQTSMLWMFAADNYTTGAGATSNLYYAPMPSGSGPLALRVSGVSNFIHNSPARLYHTARTWGDRNALKAVRRYDQVSRATNTGATIGLYSRADGDPVTITDITTWTLQGTAATNSQSITPASAITGRSIALQSVLTTASPWTAPPILHEITARAALRRELFKTRSIWVVLEKDHPLPLGARDLNDPDAVFDAIAALQTASYQTFINEMGDTETVLVEQGVQFARGDVGDGTWRTLCKIELSKVA